jgi:hypothetical protein
MWLLASQCLHQPAKFLIHFAFLFHRSADFLSKECTKAFPHTMDCDLDGTLAHLQFAGQFAVGFACSGQQWMQCLPDVGLSSLNVFGAECFQRLIEELESEATFKEPFSSHVVDGFTLIEGLGMYEIERFEQFASASFLGLLLFHFVADVVLQRGEEEGSEPTTVRISLLDGILFEKVSEVALNVVGSVVWLLPAPAKEAVEGFPVDAEELRQRCPGRQVRFGASTANQAPAGRFKERHPGIIHKIEETL